MMWGQYNYMDLVKRSSVDIGDRVCPANVLIPSGDIRMLSE